MATVITGINKSKVLSNLDTYNHTALVAGPYTVSIRATEHPTSALVLAIQQNGSTKVTTTTPASDQNHVELRTVLNCAVNDVISVVLASSAAQDIKINHVKAILVISQGLVP